MLLLFLCFYFTFHFRLLLCSSDFLQDWDLLWDMLVCIWRNRFLFWHLHYEMIPSLPCKGGRKERAIKSILRKG